MRSIKTKLFSLGMAASMLLALGGCAMSTPANVGSIGGVEIPAGVYLLAQYNSYNTASGLADLATGETRQRCQDRGEGPVHRHHQRRGSHHRRCPTTSAS